MEIRAKRDGSITVDLSLPELMALSTLPERLRSVLTGPPGSSGARRLFPPAYRDSAEEAEYRRLSRSELHRHKLETIREFEALLESARPRKSGLRIAVPQARFDFLLHFVNDMRLVLAAEVGVEDEGFWDRPVDPEEPAASDKALLHYLSGMEDLLLHATPEDE